MWLIMFAIADTYWKDLWGSLKRKHASVPSGV
jgi:hypothetical protein